MKLIKRYKWFLVLVVALTVIDLGTKALVFDALNVTDAKIHESVKQSREHYAEQVKAWEELKAKGMAPDQSPPGFRIALIGPHRHEVVEKRLYFAAVLNAGAFGGLLGGQIGVLVILSVVAVGIVGWMLLRSDLPRYQIVGGLIIAGAFGNIYDRLVYNCVRDFVEFSWPEMEVAWLNPWNTFNFADSCIVIGIIGLLLLEFFFPLKMVEPEKADNAADDKAKAEGTDAGAATAD